MLGVYLGPSAAPGAIPAAIDLVCATGGYDGFMPGMSGEEEVNRSKPRLAPLFAMLRPHQRAMLLPGVFGCLANQSFFGPPAAQAARVVRKMDAFWNWARAEPKVVGLDPWHYWNESDTLDGGPCDMKLGVQAMPSVLAKLKEIGTAIVAGQQIKTDDASALPITTLPITTKCGYKSASLLIGVGAMAPNNGASKSGGESVESLVRRWESRGPRASLKLDDGDEDPAMSGRKPGLDCRWTVREHKHVGLFGKLQPSLRSHLSAWTVSVYVHGPCYVPAGDRGLGLKTDDGVPKPKLFVVSSTSGDDNNPGTNAAPFRTLRRARNAVRTLKSKSIDGGVVVELIAGVYSAEVLGEPPLQLSAVDSGHALGQIIWRARSGDDVLITGGLAIPHDSWAPRPGHPGQVQANLTALGLHDLGAVAEDGAGHSPVRNNISRAELFYDRQPMQLARWPNIGHDGRPKWAYAGQPFPANCTASKTCTGFSFSSRTVGLLGWPPISTARVTVPPPSRLGSWAEEARIGRPWLHGYFMTDHTDYLINFTSVRSFNSTDATLRVGGFPINRVPVKEGARFAAINLRSELDAAQEYYIERAGTAQGMCYFFPPASFGDRRIASKQAFVSVAQHVVTLAPNTSFVRFEGLRFEHSRSTAVAPAMTSSDPNYWPKPPANPLTLPSSGWMQNITLSDCIVANTGWGGIAFERCNGCVINATEVYGVGGTAIRISGGNHKTLARSDNVILNCSLHHFARWQRVGTPGVFWKGVGNSVIDTRIWEAPWAGILGGGNYAVCGKCRDYSVLPNGEHRLDLRCSPGFSISDEQADCGGNDNTFERNHFFNLSWETNDVRLSLFLSLPLPLFLSLSPPDLPFYNLVRTAASIPAVSKEPAPPILATWYVQTCLRTSDRIFRIQIPQVGTLVTRTSTLCTWTTEWVAGL
jgi:hypothetical protein